MTEIRSQFGWHPASHIDGLEAPGYLDKHMSRHDRALAIVGALQRDYPHGAGLNGVWRVDIDAEDNVTLSIVYDHMNEHGFYDVGVPVGIVIDPTIPYLYVTDVEQVEVERDWDPDFDEGEPVDVVVETLDDGTEDYLDEVFFDWISSALEALGELS